MIIGVVSRGGRGWRSEQATTVRKNEKIASGGGKVESATGLGKEKDRS